MKVVFIHSRHASTEPDAAKIGKEIESRKAGYFKGLDVEVVDGVRGGEDSFLIEQCKRDADFVVDLHQGRQDVSLNVLGKIFTMKLELVGILLGSERVEDKITEALKRQYLCTEIFNVHKDYDWHFEALEPRPERQWEKVKRGAGGAEFKADFKRIFDEQCLEKLVVIEIANPTEYTMGKVVEIVKLCAKD